MTRRHRVLLAATMFAVATATPLAAALLARSSTRLGTAGLLTVASRIQQATRRARRRPQPRLTERAVAVLNAPIQDAAAVPVGAGDVLLLGGLTATDVSSDSITVASRGGARGIARLPQPVHDAAAVRLGGTAYLFGGGTSANSQSGAIVAVSAAGRAMLAGRLPAPSSDQAAAAIAGTAYIVGGYTGTRWLDTIVAWRPGRRARVVAHLPTPLRYAAVTAVAGQLVIAGGSLPTGTASATIFGYRPGRSPTRLGLLPAPTTHAAAAPYNGYALVLGGRGAGLGSLTAQIVAIDTHTGRARLAGKLTSARSDLAAVATQRGVVIAGGRGTHGTEATISEIVPSPTVHMAETLHPVNVYRHDGAAMLSGAARAAKPLVYVPDSQSATVDVIDPKTYEIVRHFAVGVLPQHIVPSYDLRTLYVTNDVGNSLTTINPQTGRPVRTIPVDDPYNLYFTPDGRYAIVVAERLHRLDFRDPHSFRLHHSLSVPCSGVDHMDFSADGRYLIASCEFSGQLVKVDVAREKVVGVLNLPDGRGGQPQDVRVSPDGRTFYVADLAANGVWKLDGRRLEVFGFVHTGAGAHGLYPSRDGKNLYVSNRGEGSVSVLSFETQKVTATWRIPGGGSPDMGGVSADGKVLWLSGRYNSDVYAISTRTGRLLKRIPVGPGPHGLCVWPQPGRYSLGHTDNMR